jgi:hypothetical protein
LVINVVQKKMSTVAFLRLTARRHFSHGVVGRRTAVSGVRFYAVPFDHQDHPARVFDAGEEFDTMGAGVIGLFQKVAEDPDVLLPLFRRDMLDYDFMNHFVLLLSICVCRATGEN